MSSFRANVRGHAPGSSAAATPPLVRGPRPSALGTVQAVLRKHVGPLRLGPTLGLRLSTGGDVQAYTTGIATAYQRELWSGLAIELEAQFGLEYIEITARRMDTPGLAGQAGFAAPIVGSRVWLTYALSSTLQLVGGASLDTAFGTSNQDVAYCAGGCNAPLSETWRASGNSYGLDLGLRLVLR